MATPAPIAMWNPNDPGNVFCRYHDEAAAWAREHLPYARDVVLAEFYLVDAPFAVVYRVRRDEHGHICTDPATGRPALQAPVTVMLDELPPAFLGKQADW